VKSQILAVEPILEGRDARPLTIWGKFICVLILSLIGLVDSTPLSAQYDSAQISGTIHDQTGAVIASATVQILNRDTGLVRQTVTNSTGLSILSHIPPGVYTITASSKGFSSASQAGVQLDVSQSATFDFSLKPGSSTETVSVSAQAVTLDTSAATYTSWMA
jgi:hypothetical protein